MTLCKVCGGPTVDGTGGPCSMECLKTAQRATIAMTQPVSPEDALKAPTAPASVSATPQTAIGAVLVWHSAEQLQRIEDKLDRLLTRLKDRGTD